MPFIIITFVRCCFTDRLLLFGKTDRPSSLGVPIPPRRRRRQLLGRSAMATFSQLLLCYFERFNIDRVSDSGVGDCARQSGSGGTGSLLGLFRILHAVEIRYGRGRHKMCSLSQRTRYRYNNTSANSIKLSCTVFWNMTLYRIQSGRFPLFSLGPKP